MDGLLPFLPLHYTEARPVFRQVDDGSISKASLAKFKKSINID